MSYINPTPQPVQTLRYDQGGVPALNGAAKSMIAIFKHALLKLGWTIAYEDSAAGKLVLKAGQSPANDFYLRLSADDGKQMIVQVYTSMSNIDSGDKKLQLGTSYKYAMNNRTGKWLIQGYNRGFWLFCESRYSASINKSGSYFFVGEISDIDGEKALYLCHSGGSYNDGDLFTMLSNSEGGGHTRAKLYRSRGDYHATIDPVTAYGFDGVGKKTNDLLLAPLCVFTDYKMFTLPGLFSASNGAQKTNFTIVDQVNNGGKTSSFIVFGSSGNTDSNFYLQLNRWDT